MVQIIHEWSYYKTERIPLVWQPLPAFILVKKRTTVLELIRWSVLYLKTMAALPVVFVKIFLIYIANLGANREIRNQSTPKGKRQFLTRHQVFLSLLFTVRDRLRGRRSKGMEKGIWGRDAPEIPIPFPFEYLPRRLCSLYRHEHKVRK